MTIRDELRAHLFNFANTAGGRVVGRIEIGPDAWDEWREAADPISPSQFMGVVLIKSSDAGNFTRIVGASGPKEAHCNWVVSTILRFPPQDGSGPAADEVGS